MTRIFCAERVLILAILLSLPTARQLKSTDDLLVIGIDIDKNNPRAYPIEILNYHKVVNDAVGGKNISVTWSPITHSNVVVDTGPFLSSNKLSMTDYIFQSNFVLTDQFTHTVWSQLGGYALSGPLFGKEERLPMLPSVLTTWKMWKKMYPTTKVLSQLSNTDIFYYVNPYALYEARSGESPFPTCFDRDAGTLPDNLRNPKEIVLVLFFSQGEYRLLYLPKNNRFSVQNICNQERTECCVVVSNARQHVSAFNSRVNGKHVTFSFEEDGAVDELEMPIIKDSDTDSEWNSLGICIKGRLLGYELTRQTSSFAYLYSACSILPNVKMWVDGREYRVQNQHCFSETAKGDSSESLMSRPFTSTCRLKMRDEVSSIDSPEFIPPEQFEAHVRIPYAIVYVFGVTCAGLLITSVFTCLHTMKGRSPKASRSHSQLNLSIQIKEGDNEYKQKLLKLPFFGHHGKGDCTAPVTRKGVTEEVELRDEERQSTVSSQSETEINNDLDDNYAITLNAVNCDDDQGRPDSFVAPETLKRIRSQLMARKQFTVIDYNNCEGLSGLFKDEKHESTPPS